jgi:uncharacterized protein YecT (DUF1311 family)
MQNSVKITLFITTLGVVGCQTLPGTSTSRSSANAGTPLAEILARVNGKSNSAEVEQQQAADPVTSTEPAQLSIGLEPAPKKEVEVSERSVGASEQATEPLSEVEQDAGVNDETMPAMAVAAEPAGPTETTAQAVSSEDAAQIENEALDRPVTVSQQLNWLPSLDETLAAMDLSVSASATLDEKIDALMNVAYVVDAKLYISFRELLDRVSPDEASLLMAEQQEWLDQRKENLTRAYLEFKADKAGRYNAAQAFLRNSHTRMREIDARLAALN